VANIRLADAPRRRPNFVKPGNLPGVGLRPSQGRFDRPANSACTRRHRRLLSAAGDAQSLGVQH
jgi:hypothetical protein